ncbi:TonB system transport protein ExbD [Cocleimonas sp. KMM 6892]|uniref:TonB system transport protein ExbD n=1 Tax=unclassified Cocleimonas TaxID=2639732 RepID=UPI002DB75281|nr:MULTISPECIES: TonB system transport protein ExbD [unclassified Cocleimonas]MEB8430652.1 TonB system transport protein ExbD [Cocleimonas sp. KMM 6892]MEC4716897.1 TonB system transport protein ExbD [Cocleimonas sp. KMM 6895]MEC4743909.1 TonB system transport protein ExbD [Cocleimonas sp. KMM 6896]
MKRFDQINMIPFIDIMLVLLAIVLTTATFISQGVIDINLPEAQSAKPISEQAEVTTIEISINANKELYIDGEPATREILATKLENIAKDTPIRLRVDQEVAFKNFVDVIDLLKKNNLEKLKIITKEGS